MQDMWQRLVAERCLRSATLKTKNRVAFTPHGSGFYRLKEQRADGLQSFRPNVLEFRPHRFAGMQLQSDHAL